MLAFLSFTAATHADPVSELDDAAARIQYAYYTADVRGIEDALGLLQRLQLPESRKGMKEYFTAYGYWKLAQLHTQEVAAGRRAARSSAHRSADACETAALDATKADPRLAEAHAILASCAALSSRAPDLLPFGSCLRHRGLARARDLAAANPRVRLIEAQCMWEERNRDALLVRVQAIARDFDALPPAPPGLPDWGYPEALVLLGRLELEAGNIRAARDAFERALIISPDYRQAKLLLEQAHGTR
jgi:tetratricopeptide (TPR) repeat protein